MRKFAILFLTMAMILSMCVPVFAVESTDSKMEAILNPDEKTMFEQMMRQLPSDEEYLLSQGLIDAESVSQPITINGVGSTRTKNYYYTTLNMPAAMFYIVATGYRNKDYTYETYNGNTCLKFTYGDTVVYVKSSAFYCEGPDMAEKSGKIGSASLISANLTNYLNSGDSSMYYTGHWRVFYVEGVQYVQLSLYGSQAFKYEEDEIVLQHRAILGITNGLNYYKAPGYPTLELQITNTGSGNRYLGGYYIKGIGSNTSVDDLAPLIELGYKAVKLTASATVSSLKFDDAASLLSDIAKLSKTGLFTKTYLSDTIPLSNIKKNVYAYSCSLKSPFGLFSEGDYFQTHIGLNGADGTSLKYKVTVSLDSSY